MEEEQQQIIILLKEVISLIKNVDYLRGEMGHNYMNSLTNLTSEEMINSLKNFIEEHKPNLNENV